MGWNFADTYTTLPTTLFSYVAPTAVNKPTIALFNNNLAKQIGFLDLSEDLQKTASILSGNTLPHNSKPFAQGYAGHQFGHFNVLGDGRAVMLGEHVTPSGERLDIQLKGSGQTPYSRRGDGRATYPSMLREYLISEAMHHLNIATTRSLAVTKTDEVVLREKPFPGGVLTRVASSHVRVGTFEFVSYLHPQHLNEFTHYVINRHYPDILTAKNPALELLKRVMEKQITLIVEWMRVGFIHGVMNTDNMSISGETIDYGPCAFMNAYNSATVFSSIDTYGRYAFGNQPAIAQWNLACLAQALLPQINPHEERAISMVTTILDQFKPTFEEKWLKMMLNKIGINDKMNDDMELVTTFLKSLEENRTDYTLAFLQLENLLQDKTPLPQIHINNEWLKNWQKRTRHLAKELMIKLMQKSNPAIVPRNHLVEEALSAALNGNLSLSYKLLDNFSTCYDRDKHNSISQLPPAEWDLEYKTYCGT